MIQQENRQKMIEKSIKEKLPSKFSDEEKNTIVFLIFELAEIVIDLENENQ